MDGRLQKGFTLVEMLVSIAVFMSVMVVAVGAFISIINANRKSQAMKSVVDNVTFAVDSISRSIKVGNDYRCTESTNANGNPEFILGEFSVNGCSDGGNVFQYYDINNGRLVQYVFLNSDYLRTIPNGENQGNIQRRYCDISESGNDCTSSWQSLTGPINNIDIKNMKFYVLGTGTEGETRNYERTRRQPRVIITVEGSSGDSSQISNTNFMLQTTVSQMDRNDG
ncbi:MAG: prepilin-type N-terminal cleavage/methylation domain-containing protein [Candidatus Paceibacterota bacterium]|jgi:prepilin-type N-terminal cleavage/methylation domain-containing protein